MTTSTSPLRIIYIVGAGRSGSTVLDTVLGNHPDAVSVGELSNLHRSGWVNNEFCACGEPADGCGFWNEVRSAWMKANRGDEFEYYLAMQEATKGKIGGTAQEQDEFFAKVIGPHPEQFWLEGCAAPCVSGTVISFKLKPGAKPVARQPIPMSPYDELRT